MCSDLITYGCDCLYINESDIQRLESLQGTLIKQCVGLGKRSHHSNLLKALCIPKIGDIIRNQCLSLYYRIFQTDTPCRDLCTELLSRYLSGGIIARGTLTHRILAMGHSPLLCAFTKQKICNYYEECGIVDTMKALLCSENFIKPYAEEHTLVTLLTNSF